MVRFGGYRAHLLPAPDYEALTLSGNELTDLTREAALEGDGRAIEGSFGLWEATTNLITNGGFETNTTGWNEQGSTTTRVTAQQKFGAAAGQVVTDNAGANEGPYHAFGGAAATKYSVSAWVRGSGTVRIALYDNVSGKQASSPVTLTSAWQRITKTATTGGGSATFRVYVETDSQQDITFNVDGVQVEAQPIHTPYVETDGGTASRGEARVRIPYLGLFTRTQGWIAMRVAAGFVNTTVTEPHLPPMLFDWVDNPLTAIIIRIATGNNTIDFSRGASTRAVAFTHAIGDFYTAFLRWTAADMGASVNAKPFSVTASTDPSTNPASTAADIGGFGGGAGFAVDSSVLWFACGMGRPTDADATLLSNFGSQLTGIRDFPRHLRTTALWWALNGRFEKVKGV